MVRRLLHFPNVPAPPARGRRTALSRHCAWFATWAAGFVVFAVRAAPDSTYIWRRWTVADGLPAEKVQAVCRTQDGYLWVGTAEGLARFDGKSFTVFGPENLPEHSGNAVSALLEVGDTLWIATNSGLLRRHGRRFDRISTLDGLPHDKVWHLAAGTAGEIWAHTEGGLVRWQNGQATPFTIGNGLATKGITWLASDANRGVVVGDAQWHARFEIASGRFTQPGLEGLAPKSDIKSVAFGPRHDVLAGTELGAWWRPSSGAGVENPTASSWRYLDEATGLPSPHVRLVHLDREGSPWVVCLPGGLHRWTGTRFVSEELDPRLQGPGIDDIEDDAEGNVWVATSAGLFQGRRQVVTVVSRREGLLEDVSNCVTPTSNGTGVWVGTTRSLARIEANRVVEYSEAIPEGHHGVHSILMDRAGHVWWTSYGLFEWTAAGALDQSARLSSHRVFGQALYEDRAGRLWIGTTDGVVCREGERTQLWTTKEGLLSNGADCFLEDRTGAMWIGNGFGLHRLREGQIEAFGTDDGLPDRRTLAVCEDSSGKVWISTDGGLARFDGTRFHAVGTAQGLPEPRIHGLLEDDAECLWLSGRRGIHRIRLSDLNAVIAGKVDRIHAFTLGTAEGMPTLETSGGKQPAGCRTRDGRLWFPTRRGVVTLDPHEVAVSRKPPPVHLERVSVDEEEWFGPVDIRVKPETNPADAVSTRHKAHLPAHSESNVLPSGRARSLQFTYSAPTASRPEEIRFRHRLLGRSDVWREVAGERTAMFTDLRPGQYVFEVSAQRPGGDWQPQVAHFDFSLRPGFRETVWFPVTCLAAVMGAMAAFVAWRLNWQRRILRAEQAQAIAGERSRIARDLHDDLGAQLTGMALRAELLRHQAGPEATPGFLELAQHARSLAGRMGEVVWALNPACDTLASFIGFLAEQVDAWGHQTGLRCVVELPEAPSAIAMRAEARHHLALFIREALTNVARHSGSQSARVSLRLTDSELQLEIADAGSGFREPQVVTSESGRSGNGLANLRARIEALEGKFAIVSRPGQGTLVTAFVPLTALTVARPVR